MTRGSNPCPVCGDDLSLVCDAERMRSLADRARRFHSARLRSRRAEELDERASFTQGDAATLLGCDRCGLLVRSPRPSAQASVHIYAEDRYEGDRIAEMIASQTSLYRRKMPLLRRLTGVSTPRVVEVGSFVGGFLEVARTAGWSAVGVDPNPQLADSCRSRGLRVLEGTLEECEGLEATASVDVVATGTPSISCPIPGPSWRARRDSSGPAGSWRCASHTELHFASFTRCGIAGAAPVAASSRRVSHGTTCYRKRRWQASRASQFQPMRTWPR